MEQISSDLWVTETENPFPGLTTRAYLWTRPDGNVLFYNTTLAGELDRMAELGGVAHQYLSHQDEITSTLATVKQRFGAKLHIHGSEAHLVETTSVDDPFTERHTALGDMQVIPVPGHTPGSTVYLATISGRRHLFTGDTIVRGENGWWAGYIEGHSNRESLLEALDVLAELNPEVIVSSAFMGASGVTELAAGAWPDAVDEARRGLLSGQQITP
ncbi:MBL fold metallo-hydrolase [Nocardia sp. NPDC127526]|uniref:MBL fold metallo-hydrolase n=1 Tax=Nocardia sp. NPDC127526 TaxID=3345393 RepID=UPI00362B12FC